MPRVLFFLFASFIAAGMAPADTAGNCVDQDARTLVEGAIKTLRKEAFEGFGSAWLPAGNQVRLAFTRKLPGAESLIFRIFATPAEQVENHDIAHWKFVPVGAMGLGETDEGVSTLRVSVPANLGRFTGASYRFHAIACGPADGGAGPFEPKLLVVEDVSVSGWGLAALVALLVVATAYGFAGWWTDSKGNPLQIVKGPFGRASLAKLQILWFSLVVLGVSVYVLMRTGKLSDLSWDVVYLLGIAGIGTASGQLTATVRERLSWDSWVLLERLGMAISPADKPSAKDLIIEQGLFDVSKFQMLTFSFVVGLALILAGISGLSNFELPQAFLGLLGLSQVIYVGGTAISPPTMADFDRQLKELRTLTTNATEEKDPAKKAEAKAKVEEKIKQVKLAFRGITGVDPDGDPGVDAKTKDFLGSI